MNIKQFLEDSEGQFGEFMKERHEQIKGHYTNPFLEKPIALESPCPKCHVNPVLFFNDAKSFTSFKLHELIGEVRKTIVDLKLQPSSGSMWANGEWSTNNKDKITSHNSALDSVLQLLDEAGGK